MLRTLPTTSHHLAICEGNYLRLYKLLNRFSLKKYAFETVNPNLSHLDIKFLVLSKTKHTVLLEAKQSKIGNNKLNNFTIRIQVSLDAKLAEVTSYQGEKPIPFFLKKSKIQSYDEKMQQNRFLTEWLESIFISGISSRKDIKDIIRND
ncbi:MAG: hypothetical protein ACI9SS_000320 [Gammaproteobacteria bacterium]|jgi:uncharacterized protein YqiB (DUF1249 family)|tara:strand:+ start:1158 stop:1604 length:447 start_codon:yes stop_codon:yes gene_type:complete